MSDAERLSALLNEIEHWPCVDADNAPITAGECRRLVGRVRELEAERDEAKRLHAMAQELGQDSARRAVLYARSNEELRAVLGALCDASIEYGAFGVTQKQLEAHRAALVAARRCLEQE